MIKVFNIIGLLLNMSGALLVFFNTPTTKYGVYLYNKTERPELEKKAKRINRNARMGMLLLGFGFFIQLFTIIFLS